MITLHRFLLLHFSMMKGFVLLFFLSTAAVGSLAQSSSGYKAVLSELTDNSDPSKGAVVIHQDSRIEQLMDKRKNMKPSFQPNSVRSNSSSYTTNVRTTTGYRVQVFSSNAQRQAKSQAYAVQSQIKDKFPQLPVYVSYASPFWKVRIGDCQTMDEAQQLRINVRKAFPEFQQETYVVRDKIFLPAD